MTISELTLKSSAADPVRRYEVFTGAGRRRDWSAEDKARLVAESFEPDVTVSAVARRHGLTPQQLFTWRREARGTTVTVKVAHVRLCHSRMLFVRAYPRETQEMVFDAHDRAFAFFRGACTRGIYDNSGRMRAFAGRRPSWMRSSSAGSGPITGASCRCAAIASSIPWRARRRRGGRRGVRDREGEPRALSRPVRRLPCRAGLGVQDLPRALR